MDLNEASSPLTGVSVMLQVTTTQSSSKITHIIKFIFTFIAYSFLLIICLGQIS